MDSIELVVARRAGRTLNPAEGFLAQMAALLIIALAIWLLYATGIATAVAQAFGQWYASQIHLGPSPKP